MREATTIKTSVFDFLRSLRRNTSVRRVCRNLCNCAPFDATPGATGGFHPRKATSGTALAESYRAYTCACRDPKRRSRRSSARGCWAYCRPRGRILTQSRLLKFRDPTPFFRFLSAWPKRNRELRYNICRSWRNRSANRAHTRLLVSYSMHCPYLIIKVVQQMSGFNETSLIVLIIIWTKKTQQAFERPFFEKFRRLCLTSREIYFSLYLWIKTRRRYEKNPFIPAT